MSEFGILRFLPVFCLILQGLSSGFCKVGFRVLLMCRSSEKRVIMSAARGRVMGQGKGYGTAP